MALKKFDMMAQSKPSGGPILFVFDEPTGSLDTASAQTVGRILCELSEKEQAILVCVTHSEALAGQFQRRMSLVDGRLVELK